MLSGGGADLCSLVVELVCAHWQWSWSVLNGGGADLCSCWSVLTGGGAGLWPLRCVAVGEEGKVPRACCRQGLC